MTEATTTLTHAALEASAEDVSYAFKQLLFPLCGLREVQTGASFCGLRIESKRVDLINSESAFFGVCILL